MFKHLRGERGYVICPNPKHKNINNETILTSTLAAGIVQDTFAGEAGEGGGVEEETTGGYFYCYFYRSGWKFFRFLALEFLSQKTNTRMRIRNLCTYTYI